MNQDDTAVADHHQDGTDEQGSMAELFGQASDEEQTRSEDVEAAD